MDRFLLRVGQRVVIGTTRKKTLSDYAGSASASGRSAMSNARRKPEAFVERRYEARDEQACAYAIKLLLQKAGDREKRAGEDGKENAEDPTKPISSRRA